MFTSTGLYIERLDAGELGGDRSWEDAQVVITKACLSQARSPPQRHFKNDAEKQTPVGGARGMLMIVPQPALAQCIPAANMFVSF